MPRSSSRRRIISGWFDESRSEFSTWKSASDLSPFESASSAFWFCAVVSVSRYQGSRPSREPMRTPRSNSRASSAQMLASWSFTIVGVMMKMISSRFSWSS